ncbi:MAG: ribbon-helix-helix domain-containing protein [Acidimicrobiales bacterium]
MKRTNIYLEEAQAAALDEASRAQAVSRAELVRRLIDRGIDSGGHVDLDTDLAAITDSFGVLDADQEPLVREADDRARHLAKVRGRH